MDNIYVHLESDSSPNFFPENTISDFRNQLAFELDINPVNYEVGLVQCSYVYNPPYLKKGTKLGEVRQWNEIIKLDYDETQVELLQSEDLRVDSMLIEDKTFLITENDLADYYKTKDLTKYKTYRKDSLKDIPEEIKKKNKFSLVTERKVVHKFESDIRSLLELSEYIADVFRHYGLTMNEIKLPEHFITFGLDTTIKNILKKPESFTPITKGSKYLYIHLISKKQSVGFLHLEVLPLDGFVNKPEPNKKRIKIRPSDYLKEHVRPNCTTQKTYEINGADNDVEIDVLSHTISLPEDTHSVDGIISVLNSSLKFVQFEILNNYVRVNPVGVTVCRYFKLYLEDKILAILGMTEDMIDNATNSRTQQTAPFRPYFAYGQQKMYIYMDAIENQHVGGMMAPLLRIADYKGEREKTTTQEFLHHHYVPLRNIVIDQIRMYIRTETSDYLPIEHGTFSATLHFRRKRY